MCINILALKEKEISSSIYLGVVEGSVLIYELTEKKLTKNVRSARNFREIDIKWVIKFMAQCDLIDESFSSDKSD